MVHSFIKSSNSLFESEIDRLGEQSNEFYDLKSPIRKILTENSDITKSKLDRCNSERYNRIRRYMSYYKVRTIRPLDHVRNIHGERRCDLAGLARRIPLPKGRIHRRHTKYMHSNRSPSFSIDLNKRFTNRKSGHLTNNNKYYNSEIHDRYVKWLRKRQDTNRKRRSHCKKSFMTVVRKSIIEGKTGTIQFPSTHRCIVKGTHPYSVSVKSAARSTCPTIATVCHTGTIGRFIRADKTWPSMGDDVWPVRVTESSLSRNRAGRSNLKRCSCDPCPSNLRRVHPDTGSCCCGCGCPRFGAAQAAVDGTRRSNT